MNAPTTALVLQPNIVTQVPVGMLCRDPDQPRAEISADSLTAMAADIAARGIELPIVVRSDFVIKDGERRWRAAQLAQLATVPCILAGPMTEKNNAVQWRLDQVADNHHREPLNALDWARVLRELVDVHQMAVKDIPNLLKARGIEMSRPYISNLIRLNELPDWAKALIASGVLPAGAGKYVLMTAGHAPAIANLRQQIESEAKRLEPGQSLRAELNWQVRRAFVMTAIELSTLYGYRENKPRFPWQTSCKTCTKRSQVDGDHFCLDRQCYGEKQAAADKAVKTKTNIEPGKAAAKHKPTPQEAMRRLQDKAKRIAKYRAMAVIVSKAKGNPDTNDLRAMLSLVGYAQYSAVAERRGWKKTGNWFGDFEKRAKAMNAAELHGLLIEAALYYERDDFITYAKRKGAEVKQLEKTALAELKRAAIKSPTKPEPKGKKKPTKEAKP